MPDKTQQNETAQHEQPSDAQQNVPESPAPAPDAPDSAQANEQPQALATVQKQHLQVANGVQQTEHIATIDEEELEAQLAYQNLMRQREAKKRKRIITIAIVVLVILIGAVVFILSQTNKEAEEEGANELVTGMVYQGDFATTVTANGATEPGSSTVVTPEVDGIIEDLRVEEGSSVSEGDVLFTLKNDDLDKEVREATTALQTAEREANSASASVDDAYAAYNKAVDDYNASEGEAEFDDTSLRAGIRSAEDAYVAALGNVESARTKLTETQDKADKRTVRAPVSGTIVSMSAKNGMGVGSAAGSSVSTGSASSGSLMQISDLSQMKVTVQVNEVDIANIAEGQEAKATFSALPGLELAAKVVRIASVSSGSGAEGGAGGVVTYAVDLVIPEPDPNLKPGMTATVTITTQSAPDSTIVPSSALLEGPEGKYVTVVLDPETEQTKDVPVEVVMENSSEAAVKGELKDGDAVVIGGGGAAGGDMAGLEELSEADLAAL